MKNLKKLLPLFFSILIVCVFFWKIIFFGFIPLPADILVHGTYPVKNPITSDAVSFSYPMKYVVIQYFKNHTFPLWNPYILFGTPLLANFQSGAFSITNIFYFLVDFNSAWSLQIIAQHIFSCIFMYLLLRHWKISKIGAILGGISFAFGGFNLIWSEWNSHTLTAAFIPLLIFFADRFIKEKKIFDGIFLSIILALQIFSGYPQIVFYTIPALFIVWFVNLKNLNKSYLFTGLGLFIFIILGLGIASPQILPGVELLKSSQRSYEAIPREWAFLSWRQVITFIAPDFFGNHATYNYWGDKNYTSNIGFVGVVTFTLALLAIKYFKKREIIFLIILIFVSLMFSFPTPIAIFFWEKNLFGLKAGASYRILVLFSFACSSLAGFGYDFLKNQKKSKWLSLILTGVIFMVFGIYALNIHNKIALRNLVLPVIIFGFTLIIFYKPKVKFFLVIFLLIELFYFGWKFTPFVPRNIVFPMDKITTFLKDSSEPFRVIGGEQIHVDTNMVYGIKFVGGYDAEYPLNTAKFLGVLNSNDPDANPQDRYGLITNTNSKLLDLVNTKYYVSLKSEEEKFKENKKFSFLFSDNDVDIFESKATLPRAFMVYDWEVNSLNELVKKDFPQDKRIILEENPKILKQNYSKNKVEYKLYGNQKFIIEVNTDNDGMLFVSDTYYPGWKAFVDGKETKIYKADFVFRAVEVPKGKHEIEMVYKPESFINGLKISLVSLGILAIIEIVQVCKRKF